MEQPTRRLLNGDGTPTRYWLADDGWLSTTPVADDFDIVGRVNSAGLAYLFADSTIIGRVEDSDAAMPILAH